MAEVSRSLVARHKFIPYPSGRSPRSCLRCALPPEDEVHFQVEDTELSSGDSKPRIERNELFMQIAELVSMRSTCLRGQVGAVIVREGRIISMGYNGAPSGQPDCLTLGCEEFECTCHQEPHNTVSCETRFGCQRGIHAETNAIIWAARVGIPIYDSTMYSTHSPCMTCARLLVAAGISKLYFRNDYRAARLDILDAGLCQVEKI